jgi:hypothetical protein
MAEERRKVELDGPALIGAILINVNSDESVTPLDVHPYRDSETPGQRMTRGNVGRFAALVVANAKRK